MPQGRIKLVLKVVSGAACTGTLWTAALNHKIADHPVEIQPVVVASFRKIYKTGHGYRGFIRFERQVDCPFAGLYRN